MIYIVEVDTHDKARAWFAFDEDDFVRKVDLDKKREGWTTYQAATPRQMLEAIGATPDSADDRTGQPAIFELADCHGWDTVLYRADYLLGQGVHQTEFVPEFKAAVAAVVHALKDCRIYPSDEEAMDALFEDPFFQGREGFYANMALRDQLIAMEVLADDM